MKTRKTSFPLDAIFSPQAASTLMMQLIMGRSNTEKVVAIELYKAGFSLSEILP